MADVEIKITDNSKKALELLSSRVEAALVAIGLMAESNAKKEINKVVYDTPERGYVRTGRLRNSLTNRVEASEQAVLVGSAVEYAAFVELGTSRSKPRPYLKPAVTEHAAEYREIVKDALSG